MGEKDIVKTKVVEAEVLDENGVPVDGFNAGSGKTQPPRAFLTVLRAVSILVFTFMISVIMALAAVLIFIPLLLLKMLGLVKSDVKIFKL
ncbi:MAG: hypothetical protein LBI01_00785 [Elusimicrobium sp.]|jgi:hypothetical protein|nr:hypothetical protein [Elusimicrobium sp.]